MTFYRRMLLSKDLPPYNPFLALDASVPSTLFQDSAKTTPAGIGDPVGAWADRTANGNDFTQATTANKPTRRDGYVEFDGVNDYLLRTFSATLTQPNTIFIVFRYNTDTTGDYVFDGIDTNNRHALFDVSATKWQMFGGGAIDFGTSDVGFYLMTSQFNSTLSIARENGVETAGDAGAHSLAGITLGARFSLAAFGAIDVYGFSLYNTALSTAQILAVEDYYNNKWSVF